MTQIPPRPITVRLTASTRVARAFIHLIRIPLLLGWKPSAATAARLASMAGGLVSVKASRVAIPVGAGDGFRRYIGGPRHFSLSRGSPER